MIAPAPVRVRSRRLADKSGRLESQHAGMGIEQAVLYDWATRSGVIFPQGSTGWDRPTTEASAWNTERRSRPVRGARRPARAYRKTHRSLPLRLTVRPGSTPARRLGCASGAAA